MLRAKLLQETPFFAATSAGPRKERASSEMTAFDEQISCDYNDLIRFRFLNLTGQLAFKCLKESVAATPGPHDSPKEVKEVS